MEIKKGNAEKLHCLVGNYFSIDYEGISEKEMEYIKLRFKTDINRIRVNISQLENSHNDFYSIFNQIENNFSVILDKSVDRTKNNKKFENLIGNLPSPLFDINIFKS
jgi:ribosomal 50S subunit-associated protein YjgA (DUF615 family)